MSALEASLSNMSSAVSSLGQSIRMHSPRGQGPGSVQGAAKAQPAQQRMPPVPGGVSPYLSYSTGPATTEPVAASPYLSYASSSGQVAPVATPVQSPYLSYAPEAPPPAAMAPSSSRMSSAGNSMLGRNAQRIVMEAPGPEVAQPVPKKAPAKKPFVAPARKISLRPSFSEQMAAISSQADQVLSMTKELQKKHGGGAERGPQPQPAGGLLLEVPTSKLIVGKLTSKYPSVVQFHHDAARYLFYHPYDAKEITMCMYYSDMGSPEINGPKRKFIFRISHSLVQFGADYYPSGPLAIEFSSDVDLKLFKEKVWPIIQQ
jgi:hypothetical protein